MKRKRRDRDQKLTSGQWLVNAALALIVLLWTIPSFGLLVSSFRTPEAILGSGWWNVFPHRDYVTVDTVDLPDDTPLRGDIAVDGAAYTNRQLSQGVVTADGRRLVWGDKAARVVDVQELSWTADLNFTTQNYDAVLSGKTFQIIVNGAKKTFQGDNLLRSFFNTFTVTLPATVFPLLLAAFAAYGFAWMRFPGRKTMFVIVIALLVVPLQVALVPILRDYTSLRINGSYLSVWIAHTGFGLPLATYFMFNYISQLPRDLFESAFIDGAGHFTIFTRLIFPLTVPALASIGIFQFLWTWNDYLVALVFLGNQPATQVLSMRIADMVGSRGNDWHLLTAGAFVSMILPLAVFFSLQRYFVRGLLGGSVKG
ncbi:carbohydrate ABC transporter permease [Paenibacillus sp.]|uniref:carbohydrate ABC transporter permease n=1 Tax=Paenibacillus sp. TaxID=58172 RepID=UPI002D32D509|nr:carbohydrate ABC transporter permease [Paenibacillus sp.]HZG58147.1 carbohydrate ABC transporter permease [Paenibacillus sp.]